MKVLRGCAEGVVVSSVVRCREDDVTSIVVTGAAEDSLLKTSCSVTVGVLAVVG